MAIKIRRKIGGSVDEEDPVVYSTHPIKTAAVASAASYSGPIKPSVRIERKGRNGKTVTVLFRLPKHETLLKSLCSFLKKTFGGGGTYSIEKEYGVVEIQGDHSEQILEVVEKFSKGL